MSIDVELDATALPFGISPNPLYLYQTSAIKTAIHKIRYAITRRQGLTCILGDVGYGKSTILRYAYTEFDALDRVEARLIPNPEFVSDYAFLKAVCGEFDLPVRRSLLDLQHELQAFLVEQLQAKKVVALFIDEGQRLNNKMIEVIRGMLNFETGDSKLVQIVVSGQLDLRDRLLGKDLKAIKSRIVMPTVLNPMSAEETRAMIEWRCRITGIDVPFADEAHERIFELTGGVPRDVLQICGTARQMMDILGLPAITAELVEGAAVDQSLKSESELEAEEAEAANG